MSTNNATYKFMHDNIVKSSIVSKITQHVETTTSKNAKACTIVSTKSTGYTLQLFTIKSPFATMFVHVTFKNTSRFTSERVEIFSVMSIVVHIDGDLVFAGHIGWIGITHE